MIKKNFTLVAILIIFITGKSFSQSPFFTGKPMYEIVTKRANVYLGTFTVELFPNIAPHHARNFDSLVSTHFYDTTAFHRVVPGFVIQGGDPNTRHGAINTWGMGAAGQPIVNAEFSAAKHIRGRLSAARSTNINSATSQFFVCTATAASLDMHYSLYGRVTSGMTVVDDIVNSPRMSGTYTDTPVQKIEMFITRIGSNDTVPNAPALLTPVNHTVNVDSNYTLLKWSAVNDGIIYHLEVATDSLFDPVDTVVSRDIAATSYLFGTQTGNTRYYWRVMVNNGGHFSAYSPIWEFRTRGATSTGLQSNGIVTEPLLVYPNPANGRFSFSNIERGATLGVYDISGKLIYETIAKDNYLLIDLTRKDKGEYFYRVTNSRKEMQQGKLIIE